MLLSEEEVTEVIKLVSYKDTARKFTAYTLYQYWTAAAFGQ